MRALLASIAAPWRWRAALLAIGLLLMAAVYSITEHTAPGANPYDYLVGKSMETPVKMLMNGYLGQFLRFRMIGNLAWLGLLAGAALALRPRAWTRPSIAVLLATGGLGLIIAVKGNINFRYQATMTSVLVTAGLIAFQKLWMRGTASGARDRGLAEVAFVVVILSCVWLHRSREAVQFVGLSTAKYFVPDAILARMRELIGKDRTLLVANESAYFYFTDQYGLYYSEVAQNPVQGVSFGIFAPGGVDMSISELPAQAASLHLRRDLGIKYVFVSAGMLWYDRPLGRFLNSAGRMVANVDPYRLYEIGDAMSNWLAPGQGAKLAGSQGFVQGDLGPEWVLRSLDSPNHYTSTALPIERPAWLDLDLGAERKIDSLEVEFFDMNYRASEYAWLARRGPADPWIPLFESHDNQTVVHRIALRATITARYLRLEVRKAPHPWGTMIRGLHAYQAPTR